MCQVDQPGIVGVMTKGSKPHLPIKSGLVRSYGWREGGKRRRGQHSGEERGMEEENEREEEKENEREGRRKGKNRMRGRDGGRGKGE